MSFLLLHESMLASLSQLRLLHNHRMQCQCNANYTMVRGQTKFYKPAWLPLVLALLCLLFDPVRSCLLQARPGGGLSGGAGGTPDRSSLCGFETVSYTTATVPEPPLLAKNIQYTTVF